MTSLSRLTCVVCGPNTLHKYGRCHWCAPVTIATKPLPRYQRKVAGRRRIARTELNERELLVIDLIARGALQREVAVQLHTTREAIQSLVRRARTRAGCASTRQLVGRVGA